jgi:hypothetical protein
MLYRGTFGHFVLHVAGVDSGFLNTSGSMWCSGIFWEYQKCIYSYDEYSACSLRICVLYTKSVSGACAFTILTDLWGIRWIGAHNLGPVWRTKDAEKIGNLGLVIHLFCLLQHHKDAAYVLLCHLSTLEYTITAKSWIRWNGIRKILLSA